MPSSILRSQPLSAAVCTVLLSAASMTAHAQVLLTAPFILGSTRYAARDLTASFSGRIGQPVSRELLDAICEDIRTQYRHDGYIAPTVLALDAELQSSTPRIQVLETAIREVVIRGDAGPYTATVRERARAFEGRPIERERAQRFLRSLNDLPGLRVRASFAPDSTNPSSMTLVLDATYDALDGAVSINNRGTEELGRVLMSGRLTSNGALGLASAISVFGATSNESDRYRYGGLSIERGFSRLVARIDASDARAVFDDDYRYEAQRAHVELRMPFIASAWRLEPLIGFTARDGEGRYTDTHTRVSETRTRTAEVGALATYSSTHTSAYVRTGVTRGLDAFGADAFLLDAAAPDIRFTKSTLDAAVVHVLAARWQIRIDAEGQWSGSALPAGQRFTFGGAWLGRAFDPAELVGDRGAAVGLQLEHSLRWFSPWVRQSSVYVQSDYGYAHDRWVGGDDAASASVGFKAAFASMLTGFEVSYPLDRSASEAHRQHTRCSAYAQMRF